MSMTTSVEDEESLYDYLRPRGLGLKKPSPFLRLRQPPPMPETYRGMNTGYPYVMQAPEQNPDYAFVGNRDNFSGNWHRLGDPVTEDAVGKTTYGHIGEGQRFQPAHHNMNLPRESSLTEEQLRGKLNEYNLPTNGDRSSLFKRMINTKESNDIMQKLGNGERPSELEMADVINRHEPNELERYREMQESTRPVNNPPKKNLSGIDLQMHTLNEYERQIQEAENIDRLNQIKTSYENDPILKKSVISKPSTQERLQEAHQLRQSRSGMDRGAIPYPATAQDSRPFNANMGGLSQATSALPGAVSEGVSAGEGALAAEGAAGASSMSGMAWPLMNLGLMAYGMYSNSQANTENERTKKTIEGNQM